MNYKIFNKIFELGTVNFGYKKINKISINQSYKPTLYLIGLKIKIQFDLKSEFIHFALSLIII